MPNTPTPGQVAYEAYCQHQQWKNYQGLSLPPWQDNLRQDIHAAWEAAAQAVRPRLTAWERGWLLAHLSPLADAEREIWCLWLEKYFGDHALARAIYDHTPLEDNAHA